MFISLNNPSCKKIASLHISQLFSYLCSGRYEDAEAQYQECLRLQPNHTITLGNLARLLRKLGQTNEAEQLLLRSVSYQLSSNEFIVIF